MSSQPKHFYTPEEYLELERQAAYKSEYLNGEIFAMSSASPNHTLIVTNLARELSLHLKQKPCTVHTTDLRLRVSQTGLYTYPDVIVVCGEMKLADDQKDTLLNPTVLIEVLSPSTKNYDRGEKFEHYRNLESLKEYVLIDQEKYHITQYVRQPDEKWLFSETKGLETTLHLPSIECDLALSEVYDKVRLT